MSSITVRHEHNRLTGGLDESPIDLRPLKRCDSCKVDDPPEPLSATDNLVDTDLRERQTASQLQIQWGRAMCDELKLPRAYLAVHVLLIQWEECDWPIAIEREILELKQLFESSFNFEVERLKIPRPCNGDCKKGCEGPQTHLDEIVDSFFQRNGGEKNQDNLAILYYTGHGYYNEAAEHLELSGREFTDANPRVPKVIWNHTEQHFMQTARCDILAIMDCCMAAGLSTIVQGIEGRTYEYLVPTELDAPPLPRPGKDSFTCALIKALKQMLVTHHGKSFTTFQLQAAIQEQKLKKCAVNYGHFVTRIDNSRRIELQPVSERKEYFDESDILAHLKLRIELKQRRLTPEQFEKLARAISQAVWSFNEGEGHSLTRRVDFIGLDERKLTLKGFVRERMSMRSGIRALKRQKTQEVEATQKPKPSMEKAGVFAVFGWKSPRMHLTYFTIVLQRPWSYLLVGTVFGLIFARIAIGPRAIKRVLGTIYKSAFG